MTRRAGLARLALVVLLIFGGLRLDGLFAIPSMSPQESGSFRDAGTTTAPAAATPDCPLGDPGEIVTDCSDPNPGGCWTYAADEVTVIPRDCAAAGIDPSATIAPMPADWVACSVTADGVTLNWWAADCSMGADAGATPEPTP